MQELTFFSLFLLGLSYGSTACMFTCMPFLSPLLITHNRSIKSSMRVMIPFSLGRMTSYAFIAVAAFYSSVGVKSFIENEAVTNAILGGATIAIALFMLFSAYKKRSCCSSATPDAKSIAGYFVLGVGISLNPCLPVLTLIGASINAGVFVHALGYGLSFGIGAVATSLLVFGFILSKMAKEVMIEFAKYKTAIEKFAGFVLLIVGIFTLNGWMHA